MFKTIIVDEKCDLNNGIIAGKKFADYIASVFPSSVIVSSDDLVNVHLGEEYAFILPSSAVCMNKEFAEKAVSYHKNFGYDLTYIKSEDKNSGFYAYVINNSDFSDTVKNGVYSINDTALCNNLKIGIYTESCDELTYVNSPKTYAKAYSVIRKSINDFHMDNGVVIINPDQTYIDADIKIGKGTVIYPNVYINGKTEIGCDCIISPNSVITDLVIENGAKI